MDPALIRAAATPPFSTRERCEIRELWNAPSDAEVSLAEARVPPGVTTERHALSVDERYVITKGRGRLDLAGDWYEVSAGDVATIPAGCPQRIENTGDEDLVFLCLCTPRFAAEGYRPLPEDGS